ncbi:hypothetical protein RRG08_012672 [Elysia crispata]|uniref:Uncharacterized protein n=1 Tax=Elysia crispata TaxID=231223 RepID=A0AAE0YNK3_9GAST|nr:hypothetical protein RRG08_012672 [Elysia crispata]
MTGRATRQPAAAPASRQRQNTTAPARSWKGWIDEIRLQHKLIRLGINSGSLCSSRFYPLGYVATIHTKTRVVFWSVSNLAKPHGQHNDLCCGDNILIDPPLCRARHQRQSEGGTLAGRHGKAAACGLSAKWPS